MLNLFEMHRAHDRIVCVSWQRSTYDSGCRKVSPRVHFFWIRKKHEKSKQQQQQPSASAKLKHAMLTERQRTNGEKKAFNTMHRRTIHRVLACAIL